MHSRRTLARRALAHIFTTRAQCIITQKQGGNKAQFVEGLARLRMTSGVSSVHSG